ncbi:Cof-type HAD-IIB family hydrolase [Natranaerofaba carboxydovora]|uniref:Cof-type HAD-IIB family hydrolase n=1 Tax=Natranaerofaba carboxydovora TaxID=2742683 RepID=UPI001F12D5BC|nr:Cof-type HAD-IIB family hydrolase [Natranaerofaba carboxydovora]
MKYEFVAIDIDDTLLNKNLEIPEQNKTAIKKAVESGVMVTLATGRMFCSAVSYAKELELDLPLIAYHGALIKNTKDNEVLYHNPVPEETARKIAGFCQEKDLQLNVYIDDVLYVAKENELTDYYIKIANVPCRAVGDLVKFINKPPTKLTVVVHDGDMADSVTEELKARFEDKVIITQSKKRFVEIINSEVDKGKAIEILTRKFGKELDKTMAIGDSLNDIPMLYKAGLGVCVKNARPQAKEACDVEVAANDDAGVGEAIHKYVLENL